MEYVKDVLGYYIKNFVYLLIFAVIPATFLGLFIQPFGLYDFVYSYHDSTLATFGDFFMAIFNPSWWSFLYVLVGGVLFVVSMSMMLGFIENHFRVGKRSLQNSFRLNNNTLSVLKTTVILGIAIFILDLLAALLMCFIHFLSANSGAGSVVCCILNYIIVLALMVLVGRGLSLFGFATVESLLDGSPMRVGFSNAARAMSGKGWQLFMVELITMGVCFILMQIFSLIALPTVGNILSCIVFMPMVCINSMMLFFDANKLTRKDKLKYYQRK